MSTTQNASQKPRPGQKPRPSRSADTNLDALYKPVGIQAITAASICKKPAK